MEFYRFIDELLIEEWDPIGVSDVPEARDEYRSYLPQVFSKAISGESAAQIAEYLRRIETEQMGLSGYRTNTLEIAKKVLAMKGSLGLA